MYKTFIFLMVCLLLAPLNKEKAAAFDDENTITPYGDFYPFHTNYGMCAAILSIEQAKITLDKYYNEKGLFVRLLSVGDERFIRAEVRDKQDKVVDIIIMDRRSGRLRSIY
ncbi:secreted protein [Candidatus Magnetoovum chiemensis]|nr:secreted protein [Candidatus Magnetoovum chiemensis]